VCTLCLLEAPPALARCTVALTNTMGTRANVGYDLEHFKCSDVSPAYGSSSMPCQGAVCADGYEPRGADGRPIVPEEFRYDCQAMGAMVTIRGCAKRAFAYKQNTTDLQAEFLRAEAAWRGKRISAAQIASRYSIPRTPNIECNTEDSAPKKPTPALSYFGVHLQEDWGELSVGHIRREWERVLTDESAIAGELSAYVQPQSVCISTSDHVCVHGSLCGTDGSRL
jgi:hypothetical protein